MNFEKEYIKIYLFLYEFQKLSRREGLLALEDLLDEINEYPILKDGLRLVVNGSDITYIEEYFNNVIKINYSKVNNKRILVELMKAGTLHIQSGSNINLLNLIARSLCPIQYKKIHKLILDMKE